MKHLLLILTLFLSLNINSAEGAACGKYLSDENSELGECEEFQADHSDKASLQRGAKIYFNYCYGCHSLKYSRYNRIAKDLEIPENLFEEYLLFGDQKMGDLIQISMEAEDSKEWFGVSPPDLTLEASLRGEEWIYTYLISFYEDQSRPFGVNNKVYENVGMPHVLSQMQGIQQSVCKDVPLIAANGGLRQDPLSGEVIRGEKCGFLELSEKGEMSQEQFNASTSDLTNFLSYVSDPIKEEREYLGKYVILYLIIFSVLSYLLYREFKKDIH